MEVVPGWGVTVDVDLAKLSVPVLSKEPRCCVCGYNAMHLIRVGTLERLYCPTHLLDVLLDAIGTEEPIPA